MQGLNVRVNVIARPQDPDDSVGGSVRQDLTRYSNVLARIANVSQPTLLASQGFEGKDLHKIILYPDIYPAIEREDIIVPLNGRWATPPSRFRVIEVRPSSVLTGGTRAHVQLLCERIRYADDNVAETAYAPTPFTPPVTLASPATVGLAILVLTDSAGTPTSQMNQGMVLQIQNERMMIANILSPSRITVVRGFNSIEALHAAGTAVERAPGQE